MRTLETMARLLLLWLFLISVPSTILLTVFNILPGAGMYLAIYEYVVFLGFTNYISILGLMAFFYHIFYAKLRYHSLAASLICVFLSFIITQSSKDHIPYDSRSYAFFTEIEGYGLRGGAFL